MIPRILFIDGDIQVLGALRAGLKDLEGEWEMVFAEGTAKAMGWLRDDELARHSSGGGGRRRARSRRRGDNFG